MTKALPLPALTNVPAKMMLCCCVSGIAALLLCSCDAVSFGCNARFFIASADFETGWFSPVNDDSSIRNSTESTTRQSAGTRSPVASKSRSPTTNSSAGSLSKTRPSRNTVATCGTKCANFSNACSDRYSCTAATKLTMSNAIAILIASLVLPRAIDIAAENISIKFRGSFDWSASAENTGETQEGRYVLKAFFNFLDIFFNAVTLFP
mmetsp:Transcript_3016/g.6786  ORF Transcript_3016/g.6786 Transcript_3016/m.6786 type:complete len:208 (-) Transcript_3016:306-929(-)